MMVWVTGGIACAHNLSNVILFNNHFYNVRHFIILNMTLETFTKLAQDRKWVNGSWGLNTFSGPHSSHLSCWVYITVVTVWLLVAFRNTSRGWNCANVFFKSEGIYLTGA